MKNIQDPSKEVQATASSCHSRHRIDTKQGIYIMLVLFDQFYTAFETWEESQGRCIFLYCIGVAQYSKFLAHLTEIIVSLVLQPLVNFAFLL